MMRNAIDSMLLMKVFSTIERHGQKIQTDFGHQPNFLIRSGQRT